MSFDTLKFSLTGESPLLCHNGRLSNPLDPFAKALKAATSKRKKTDEDIEKCAEIEFKGSLYVGEDGAPVVPSYLIEAAILNAAKKTRQGKIVQAGVAVENDMVLDYEGPKTVDELWKDDSFRHMTTVRVQQNRVLRTRPIFSAWSGEVEVKYDAEQIDRDDVVKIVQTAGELVGVGDWRPKYGRFTAEVVS